MIARKLGFFLLIAVASGAANLAYSQNSGCATGPPRAGRDFNWILGKSRFQVHSDDCRNSPLKIEDLRDCSQVNPLTDEDS